MKYRGAKKFITSNEFTAHERLMIAVYERAYADLLSNNEELRIDARSFLIAEELPLMLKSDKRISKFSEQRQTP